MCEGERERDRERERNNRPTMYGHFPAASVTVYLMTADTTQYRHTEEKYDSNQNLHNGLAGPLGALTLFCIISIRNTVSIALTTSIAANPRMIKLSSVTCDWRSMFWWVAQRNLFL